MALDSNNRTADAVEQLVKFRTADAVAFYIGDRSEKSCIELWNRVPKGLKNGYTFSDFWKPYQKIIKSFKHESVGKDSGKTNHMERWNNTLRQWLGRYT